MKEIKMYNILVILILVVIKAIFSAGDTAITYINKAKVSQKSKTDKKSQKIKILAENNAKFYGTLEVGITLMELLATAFAAETFVKQLMGQILGLNIEYKIAELLAVVVVAVILSYVLLVFGGLIPKKIARNDPEKYAYKLVNILWIFSKINYPFEKIIDWSTKIFSEIFGISDNPKIKLTEKEIKLIIKEGKEQGIIAEIEKEILLNALKFDDILVKEIMIPKEKVEMINKADSEEKILDKIKKHKYTRIPIYNQNKNNIEGILNIKDLIMNQNPEEKLEINKTMRKPIFVRTNDKISIVFKEMQINSQAMVIVKDKEGNFVRNFNNGKYIRKISW